RFLCGSLRVAGARAARTLPEVRGETVATIFLETATGAPVVVTGTMAAPGYPPRAPDRLEIVGTRASAVLADSELSLLGPRPRRAPERLSIRAPASGDPGGPAGRRPGG